ncbi:D-galactose 1-dehydrogenase [Blastomonas natatoria]|uniref:D-galactose 1-dehydrogenase n=1 Tax=Blastomonas natatoria TaxID=34015 RepID=A0A2V3VAB4_9SPHN|nr:Gfo/Idh/MocA family oxidoreductase [Blastomonas natatoria]PXW77688.1 D-galactose 1-dehydrogenase [Blastomonas natatoria]
MISLGLVGLGKIARDQHLPAIARSADFTLCAVASRNARADGVPAYPDLDALLAREQAVEAVVLCQPPQVRHAAARAAMAAGRHVFLEKPPGATLSEVEDLVEAAGRAGVTLFASWHSRFAAGVEPARSWLAGRRIEGITIEWKEDVRQWHPGQDWIWQPGGLGVFDPGINALSILTRLLPGTIRLEDAELQFPANRQAPIAARLQMRVANGTPVEAEFDWRQTGRQSWNITIHTDAGALLLADGGNSLFVEGAAQALPGESEYPAMYDHFAALIAERRSDVDASPLRLVADAFLIGRRSFTEAFHD